MARRTRGHISCGSLLGTQHSCGLGLILYPGNWLTGHPTNASASLGSVWVVHFKTFKAKTYMSDLRRTHAPRRTGLADSANWKIARLGRFCFWACCESCAHGAYVKNEGKKQLRIWSNISKTVQVVDGFFLQGSQ